MLFRKPAGELNTIYGAPLLFSRIHLITCEVCPAITNLLLAVTNLCTQYLFLMCYRSVHMISEVLTAVTMKSTIFWGEPLLAWLTLQPEDGDSIFL
jgi:hypothetical protein